MPYYVAGPDGTESGPYELELLIEWARGGRLPRHAPVRDEGSQTAVQASQMIELAPHLPATQATTGNAIIPMGNPDALWAYYLGFASLLCVIGLFAAPFAYMRASKGLKNYANNPQIYGKAHAIVGIALTSIGTLYNIVLVFMLVASIVSANA